jgi:lipopolysaccharide export system protein LptA
MRALGRIALAVVVCWVLGAGPAAAQGFNLGRNNNEQIQVFADNGIEWMNDAQRVIARGTAKAIRGTVTVNADTLTAYYRKGASGDEIWRLDADGNVTIATPTEIATGNKASYDLDKAVFVLRGTPAKLVTPTDTVTAKDSLEYWEKDLMAVARGDAVAIQKDKQIQADVLTSHFREGAKGSLEMRRADAYRNVILTTPQEQVFGERGDYNLESGIATVTGSVKIVRTGNELNGEYAHVNLKTGISKLFGTGPGGQGEGRVSGTFTPDKKDKQERRAIFSAPGASGGGSDTKRR